MELKDTTTWSYPMAPTTERGQATHLTSSPDGKTFAYGSQSDVILRQEDVKKNKFMFLPLNSLLRISIFRTFKLDLGYSADTLPV